MIGLARNRLPGLADRAVWLRALKIGLPVGIVQVAINQGDYWMARNVDSVVLAKTIISPLVTFSVALIASAGMRRERYKHNDAN